MRISITISDLNEAEAEEITAYLTQRVTGSMHLTESAGPAAAPPPGDTTGGEAAPPPEPAAAHPVTGEALDAEGLPWDKRIHSRNATLVKSTGKWKLKRDVNPALVAEVNAENRQRLDATAAEAGGTAAPPPAAPPPAAPPPDDAAAHPPAAAGAPEDLTYPMLMQLATSAGYTPEQIKEACVKHGIPSTAMLAAKPDMWPLVYAELFPG